MGYVMSSRREAQKRVNSVQVSSTIDRELYDFLEDLEIRRLIRSRSHGINLGLECLKHMLQHNPGWFMERQAQQLQAIRNSQQSQQPRQPQPGRDPRYSR